MFLHCFENLNADNLFFEGRFVYQRLGNETPGVDPNLMDDLIQGVYPRPKPEDLKSVADKTAKNAAEKKENDVEAAKSQVKEKVDTAQKTSKALNRLKADTDRIEKESTKAHAIRSAKRGEKEVMKRVVGEVFENNKEQAKQFKERVRKSIETMDPNALYAFVEKHHSYGGDFLKWNEDFCELLGVDEKDPREQRKYAAGLQLFLTSKFANSPAPFTFELKKNKRINRFTYIDGMLGGYTISVLRAYLVKLHPKKKDEWEMKYATLSSTFTDKYPSRKPEFRAAMNHLGEYFGKKSVKVEDDTAVVKPSQDSTVSKGRVTGYPKLNPSASLIKKAEKKPQTKYLIEAFVDKRVKRERAKLNKYYILQVNVINGALKNYDISDLSAFENVRNGSKYDLIIQDFLKIAKPLIKLKERAIRDVKAEGKMEKKYVIARLNLLDALAVYYHEEEEIQVTLKGEFTNQTIGASLAIEMPMRYRSNFDDIMGTESKYKRFHNELVSNFLHRIARDRIPKQFNKAFLMNPKLITKFIKLSLNNKEIRTYRTYAKLKESFRGNALEMLNKIFPAGTPSNEILVIMNQLIVMANCYRFREEAGLKEEVYQFRLKEEQRKVDPKSKKSGSSRMIASVAH